MPETSIYFVENRRKSLLKALSWRIMGTLTTFCATLSLTSSVNIATTVGIIEFASKILLYYFHERIWVRINTFIASRKRST